MYLDGRPVTVEELAALALGNYGHFTSMLVTDGRVRGLSLHLERLVADCARLFDHDLDADRIRDLIRRVELPPTSVVRVTVYQPDLDLPRPAAAAAPRVLVTTRAAASHPVPPLRVRSQVYQRDLAQVKHVGLFASLTHRAAAQRSGADDVLFVDATSAISEGATWNVGLIDGDDRLVWPVADCLPGVTQRLLDGAWRRSGRAAVQRRVHLADRRDLRAAFATNAAVGVRPVSEIDGTAYPADHPMLSALSALYAAVPAERI
jgi:branched-subunit amino acid aminotransferase/4-amino-4-deoxychorismate lyase